jgi:hypothetical protein
MIKIEATFLNQRTSKSERLDRLATSVMDMLGQMKDLLNRRDSYIALNVQCHVSLHITGWVHPYVTIEVPPPSDAVAGEEQVG